MRQRRTGAGSTRIRGAGCQINVAAATARSSARGVLLASPGPLSRCPFGEQGLSVDADGRTLGTIPRRARYAMHLSVRCMPAALGQNCSSAKRTCACWVKRGCPAPPCRRRGDVVEVVVEVLDPAADSV